MAKILIPDVQDEQVRQNFSVIVGLIGKIRTFAFMLLNWAPYETVVTSAGTKTVQHSLGVIPTDFLVTRQQWSSGSAGTVAVVHTGATKTTFNITVSGGTIGTDNPLTVGGFVGRKD